MVATQSNSTCTNQWPCHTEVQLQSVTVFRSLREKLYRRHEEAEPGEAAGEGDLSGERAHLGSGPRAGRASGGGAKE